MKLLDYSHYIGVSMEPPVTLFGGLRPRKPWYAPSFWTQFIIGSGSDQVRSTLEIYSMFE